MINDSKELALRIVEAALEKKAEQIEAFNVRDLIGYTDFVVIMSGKSDRQVRAIADEIERTLRTEEQIKSLGIEGRGQAQWILMDFNDVVVHIFHQSTREFYNIEGLWLDTPRLELDLPEEQRY